MDRVRWRNLATLLAAASSFACTTAVAHSFTQTYAHPIPAGTSGQATMLVLLLSCALVGVAGLAPAITLGRSRAPLAQPSAATHCAPQPQRLRWALLAALVVCIATGLLGTQNRFGNLGMSLFWIGFAVVLPLLAPALGDLLARASPWRALADLVLPLQRRQEQAQDSEPAVAQRVGYYPAAVLHTLFAWYALFGRPTPRATAIALLLYAAANLLGARWLGREAWFARGEFFGVLWRLFAGWLRRGHLPATAPGLGGFIAIVLASLLVDAAHPRIEAGFERAANLDAMLYAAWRLGALPAAAALGGVLFVGVAALLRRLTRSALPFDEFSARLSFSLLPLVFALFAAHHFTLLLAHATHFGRLLGDPFGWGWNLLGLARWNPQPVIPEARLVWNIQVCSLLLGHLWSLACALRLVADERAEASRGVASLAVQAVAAALLTALTAAMFWALSMPAVRAPLHG